MVKKNYHYVGVLVSTTVLALVGSGLYNVFNPGGENGCQMTYMWEYPEYLEVMLSDLRSEFPHYALFLYGEGVHAAKLRSSPFKMDGIPCLFLPGNAGSHRQVRSLASVTLRMAEERRARHFNWFSVSYNEEMSGVYGASLQDQARFAAHCVRHILSLYSHLPSGSRPSSVLVIGHSMGGLVARAMLASSLLPRNSVHTIITLASPHQRPPLPLDSHLCDFYRFVNQFWQSNMTSPALSNVVIVSIAGGQRDALIPALLTPLAGVAGKNSSISTVMAAIPHVWTTTDHLAVMWCRQLVLSVSSSLFQLVDRKTNQIVADARKRLSVLSEHLNSRSAILRTKVAKKDIPSVQLAAGAVWVYGGKPVSSAYAFPIQPGKIYVLVTNVHGHGSLAMCSLAESSRVCSKPAPIPPDAVVFERVLPPLYSAIQVIHINMSVLQDSHLVFQLPRNSKTKAGKSVFATSQLVEVPERSSLSVSQLGRVSMVTNDLRLMHSIRLVDLTEPWQAFSAVIKPVHCDTPASSSKDVSVSVVVSSEASGYAQTQPEHTSVDVSGGDVVQHSLYVQSLLNSSESVQLLIYAQYPCAWEVSVSVDFYGVIVQFCRNYVASAVLLLKFVLLTFDTPWIGMLLSVLLAIWDSDGYINVFGLPGFIVEGSVWLVPALFTTSWALCYSIHTIQCGIVSFMQRCCCASSGSSASRTVAIVLSAILMAVSSVLPVFTCSAVSRAALWLVLLVYIAVHSKTAERQAMTLLLAAACTVLMHSPSVVFWVKACVESGTLVALGDARNWLKASVSLWIVVFACWLRPMAINITERSVANDVAYHVLKLFLISLS